MNCKNVFIYVALLALALPVCGQRFKQQDFPNLLSIEVGNRIQPGGYLFSDLGNWHGYGLNNPSDLEKVGGFRGPAFLAGTKTKIQWLSDCFEQLNLKKTDGELIPYIQAPIASYLPGMLTQQLKTETFTVTMTEIAVSDKSTMTEFVIVNHTEKTQLFKADIRGSIAYKSAILSAIPDGLMVSVETGKHHLAYSLPESFQLTSSQPTSYQAETGIIKLRPGKSVSFYSFTTFCPFSKEDNTLNTHRKLKKSNGKHYLSLNEKRWNKYLNNILDRPTPYLQVERNRNWAVKSLMTLYTNWRSAAGDLKHAGVVPGTGSFDAFWAWDSWEHAVALSLFNPELAKDQMRTMFDFQTPEGMIIDLISIDSKENNPLCSKPPIAGWGTYMVYQRTKDISFLREMMPKLLKYHEWRYKYRDHDKNGLCEYGGTKPDILYGQWESGMDVAVKFDGAKILENSPGAYSMDQESIELNSYLCAEKFYLSYMAQMIGEDETARRLKAEGEQLKKLIQEKFFDEETGYFYDIKVGSGDKVKVIDISGWIPLLTQIATPEQAARVKDNMLDPELFGTYFPFSSLNHKHPLYHPGKGYFRGQTWMNYTYFGIRGFKNYGYMEDARKYTNLIPDKLKGIADKGYPIRENYHSATGEGMSVMNFSWSSAFSLLLLCEDSEAFPYVPFL